MAEPNPTLRAVRRMIGAVAIFAGALSALASVMFALVAWVHRASTERPPQFSTQDEAGILLSWALAGAFAYAIGRLLMPEKLGGFGRLLTATGFLWWVLTGLCHAGFYASEKSGLVHAGAFAIIGLGAVMIAIGQTLRPAGVEPTEGKDA